MPPVGRVGLIKQGDMIGWYILIEDDRKNTGGYLILTCNSRDFSGESAVSQGYDGWVVEHDLPEYIRESGWEIEWDPDLT